MYSILYTRLGEKEMEKFGRILLLILNILLNTFLVIVALILIFWLFFGVSPEISVQKTANWIQHSWDSLTGYTPTGSTETMSQKQKRRAYRNIYVQTEDDIEKNKHGHISQPHKYEYKKDEL